MADSFIIAVAAIVAGGFLGAGSAWFGWNKSGEPFDNRKFVNGVVTGIIAGIALVLGNISGLLAATTATDVLLQLVGLGLMIFGADQVRTGVSAAIANRATSV